VKPALVLALSLLWVAPAQADVDFALRLASARTGVPRRLLHSVAWVESRLNPAAVSPRGARGLMQLMPVILQRYHVRDPFDARQNALAGAQLLRHNHRAFQTWPRALAAFNWGSGNVARTPRAQWPQSVRRYVRQVCRRWVCGS
jgi:soluble lytic murein transglycosylase-like protein